MGQSPRSEYYNSNEEGMPFLQGNRTFGDKYPNFDTYTTNPTKIANVNDVIMSVRAPVGDLNITPKKICLGRGVCSIHMKNGNQDFLYYLMKYYVKDILNRECGTVFGSVNKNDISSLIVKIPERFEEQKKISSILSVLDDKIELNNKINRNLETQAQAIFKSWFIDFEPFGGKMPANWKTYQLKEFLPVVTGKKNANVSSKEGSYPFFSCSQDIAWCDSYSFEGNAILVAGNGDFNVKFYNGKFEAYQRTYVLIPFNQNLASWLYYLIQYYLNDITSGARGSVISFITKGNLENLTFYAPESLDNFQLIDVFRSINKQIRNNCKESQRLAQLRDALLPKLMSGEIDVTDIAV